MDWAKAVEKNRIALTHIVAEIFAMLNVVAAAGLLHLPQALYVKAQRLLRPTESAVRRLIIIAARGLVVKPVSPRPMPQGLVFSQKVTRRKAFQLFDTRLKFEAALPQAMPMFVAVKTYASNPYNLFDPMYWPQRQAQNTAPHAAHFFQRLEAVKHALENLSSQARRMARAMARRKNLERSKFKSPIRPGPPPGHCAKPSVEVDFILQDCHFLAWDTLRVDSS
jgi:hypothetical protein